MDKIFETQSFSETFGRYLGMAWHWAWLLALMTALAGGSAYYHAMQTTPIYQASTLALVNPAPATKALDLYTMQTSEALAQTYIKLMITRPVLEGVIRRAGLSVRPDTLGKAIQAEVVKDTQLIVIRVEDTDPVRAALTANALVAEFSDQNMAEQASRYAASKESLSAQLTQLDQQIQSASATLNSLGNGLSRQAERDQLNATLSQYRQTYAALLQSYEQVRLAEAQSISTIVQKESAYPPASPIRPQTMRDTVMAAFVGLILGVGVVLLIESLDDSLKGPDEVVRKLKLPVLGLITRIGNVENDALVTCTHPRSPVSEAFRALRTNIQYTSVDRPICTLLVTSPTPEDGKSTIATNLAVILAQGGRKTVILDADLRKPMIHKFMKLPNRKGVSDLFVVPQLGLDGNLQETSVAGLRALTSGSLPPNPAELLGSVKMIEIMNRVKEQVDIVVLDSPPLLAVTDAAVLAPRVDGVLLVIKPGVTKLAACRQAVEQLQQVGANILGVILNDVDMKRSRYRYANYYKGYYSYYHHYYSDDGDGSTRTERKKKK